jgi:hypothetical protein
MFAIATRLPLEPLKLNLQLNLSVIGRLPIRPNVASLLVPKDSCVFKPFSPVGFDLERFIAPPIAETP